ncbi:tetratricopeptide repeat protein [Mucilaginibacter lutimaris]|uniref:Tetratricopeptide repeat protein n=1 Tax=Mucilaginibacter lutimaris TaxID=931629 RepID=A0ABW2ZBC5_9SPHI
MKRLFLVFFVSFTAIIARAQTADEVYNQYLDFNLARLQGEGKALSIGQDIIPNADKLKEKMRISFFYSIGNLFKNEGQSVKAIEYYEKVAAAVPDYYVVHRALGYLYLKNADAISEKLNAAKSDINENKRLTILYIAAGKKALPHLEKAQACDPSDETLSIIKMLYRNTKDTQGAATLNSRLKAMSKTCIDLLDDK